MKDLNVIVKHLSGSRAYGTNTPESDYDYRGIYMADKKFILTPFFNSTEVEDKSEEDTKYYELNNYLQLASACNPNIIETLWVDESDVLFSTEYYEYLREHREVFLSTKVAYTYTGYAHQQFTRMDNHHSWIGREQVAVKKLQDVINKYPCEQCITFIEEYFPEYMINLVDLSSCNGVLMKGRFPTDRIMRDTDLQMISKLSIKPMHFFKLVHNYSEDKVLDNTFMISDYSTDYELRPYGENIFALIPSIGSELFNRDGSIKKVHQEYSTEEMKRYPALIVKFNEDEYKRTNEIRKNYHSWKANRNETRAALEKSFGYDGKNAAHTIRLLRTAEELLTEGVCKVKRPDAKELLEIRNGSLTYEELTQIYQEKSKYIREVLINKSVLPKKVDFEKCADILITLREMQYYK